ncbi:MAG: T9SS type A sorting domain-containing protein [Bacteroidia bacterium]|nr:T9SS type A sorting domain-containing protein [Bacteroidia bacterium]
MRKIYLLFTYILLITVVRSGAQTFNVTVKNGFGSGTYNIGDSVYILANPGPANTIFDGWTTNGAILSDSFSTGTLLKNLSADVTLTPIYTPATAWTAVLDSINGSVVYHYFPGPADKLRGVIIFFHGKNGNAKEWFQSVEGRNFLNYSVAKGYGVLATESTDRILGGTAPFQWNNNFTVATNPDIKNVGKILDTLTNRGLINYATHIYAVGYSQSGNFASILSAIKKFSGTCLLNTPGSTTAINVTTTPTYWIPSRNDVFEDSLKLSKCKLNYKILTDRGISGVLKVHEPFPVTPNRFTRIAGIDSATSVRIYSLLLSQGYFDSKSFLNFNPAADTSWTILFQLADTTITKAMAIEIANQVFICYTEDRFHSDEVYQVIQFFGMFAKWPAGILEEDNQNNLTVYPNPTSDYLYLKAEKNIIEVRMYDLLGKEVLIQSDSDISYIDLTGLNKGLYITVFRAVNNQSIIKKIIKQ